MSTIESDYPLGYLSMNNKRRLQSAQASSTSNQAHATPPDSSPASPADSPSATSPKSKDSSNKSNQARRKDDGREIKGPEIGLVDRAIDRLDEWLGDEPMDHIDMLGFLQAIEG